MLLSLILLTFYQNLTKEILTHGIAEFRLGKIQEDGSTLKDHLMQGWRQMGYDPYRKPDPLKVPPLPEFGSFIYDIYLEIAAKRNYGKHGPRALSWVDIEAWCRLSSTKLRKWELDVIAALDASFVGVWYEK